MFSWMSLVCKPLAYHVRVALAEVKGGRQGLWDCSYTHLRAITLLGN